VVSQCAGGGRAARADYEATAEAIPGAIGLSSSSVSRASGQARAAELKVFQERILSGEVLVALFLDGKSFAQATMVVALRQGRCLEKLEPALSVA
jgi:hypothetical protein